MGLTAVLGLLRRIAAAVPLWAWALAAALAYGAWQHRSATAAAAKAAKAQLEAQAQTLRADGEKRERAKEQTYAETVQNVATAYGQRVAKVHADAVGARTELDRLRDAIASAKPASCASQDAAAAGRVDAAAGYRIVLAECSGEVQSLAEALEHEKSRLRGLQDYVRIAAPGMATSPLPQPLSEGWRDAP
jgi:hypothetical protein